MEIIVYYTSTAVLCTLGLDALFLLSPCCKWSLSYICMCWNDIYCICWCQTVSHTHAHIHSDTGRGKSSHIDAIFSLWSHLWACYSTKFNPGFCIKLCICEKTPSPHKRSSCFFHYSPHCCHLIYFTEVCRLLSKLLCGCVNKFQYEGIQLHNWPKNNEKKPKKKSGQYLQIISGTVSFLLTSVTSV